VLAAGALDAAGASLLERVPGATEFSVRSATLLTWLRHVRRLMERGPRAVGAVWMSHNVHQVLESV
jgi:hypothetical protein